MIVYLLPSDENGRRDFNNTVFTVDFPLSAESVRVKRNESFVIDDDINEPSEEVFVLVLEIESNPSDRVILQEGMDVLIIRIRDNDGM